MPETSEKDPSSLEGPNMGDTPIGSLVTGDLPGLHQSYRLDGRNYLQWAQLVKTFLKGKGKLHHLTYPGPKNSDLGFTSWDIEDSMIMSWLWNAMQPEVSRNYIFLSNAKDVWETVRHIYSKVQDATIIFEIKMKLSSTKQGSLTIIEYYNKMNGLWLELDHYQDIKMVCGKDT